ncbi:MAG: endopeptidase La [Coprobacillus sp.]|nr:endopeptidase La [Coprobacillus sp.]
MAEQDEKMILPLLVTKSVVLYPGVTTNIDAGRDISLNAIKAAQESSDSLIFVTTQYSSDLEEVTGDDVYKSATLCKIVSTSPKGKNLKVRMQPLDKVTLENVFMNEDGFFVCEGTVVKLHPFDDAKGKAVIDSLTSLMESMPDVMSTMPRENLNSLGRIKNADLFCYMIAGALTLPTERKQAILEAEDIESLCDLVTDGLLSQKQQTEIEKDIQSSIRESTEKSQRDYFLRERLKAIKKELGEDEGEGDDIDAYVKKADENPYPENVKAKVHAEAKKYEMMPQGSLEGALVLSYLDTLLSLPWYQKTEDNDNLDNVEKILDEDHYGLKEPKKRIIEYLAVKQLTGNLKSPILCFYGPPGCGKTSLSKSIARALGRKFVKASLGGISDEAEIRGHRRTYVGSMPGRIISGMKRAGANNPVFLLDEIDKLANSYHGDPSSALLEVLDPEQNNAFNDNFIEEPYDLSDVLFICTANSLEDIPDPLRDRLELIELSSYTEYEKLMIAKEHLYQKQVELNGLTTEQVSFSDDAYLYIIRYYTREAGVRELERRIASCLRKIAVSIVKDPSIKHVDVDEKRVVEYLGTEIFEESKKEPEQQIGVVTGLAYTQYGGEILPIEVNYFKGRGGFVVTGNLGDVMKESCSIALDYVKANAEKYGIDPDIFENNDIHIHVPEGAVPKDGPSAGVAITTAIISCLSRKPVNPDVAMTGEVTLRGHALPIGGLREKSLAALRSGIKTIIVPKENKKDVEELPDEVKDNLTIKFMTTVDDAVATAFIQ